MGVAAVGRRGSLVLIACLAVGLVVGACSGGGDDGGAASGGAPESSERSLEALDSQRRDRAVGYSADQVIGTSSGGGGGAVAAPGGIDFGQTNLQVPGIGPDPKVIKRGEVSLELPKGEFDDGVNRVIQLAERVGGIVASTSIDDTEDKRGTIVLRVPSSDFERSLRELDEIGDIKSQFVDSADVTEEFVDLQARIRNERAQEAVLLRLMDRAATVNATIRVQRELSRVQESIERMRGRLRVLEDQTSFSTLAVEVAERGVVPDRAGSTLYEAWRDSVDAFLGVVAAVIVGAGFVVPLGIIALFGLLVFRRARQSATQA